MAKRMLHDWRKAYMDWDYTYLRYFQWSYVDYIEMFKGSIQTTDEDLEAVLFGQGDPDAEARLSENA